MNPMEAELKKALEDHGKALDEFKAHYISRLDNLEKKANREALGGFGRGPLEARPALATEEAKAFETFARTGEVERKSMSIGDDTQGGYTVTTGLANQITLVGAEQGAIRKLARIETPDTGDFAIVVGTTLAGAAHVGEVDTRQNTATPNLAQIKPPNGGLAAVAPVTNWLLNDSKYDIAAFVIQSIGEQFGVTESADFVLGDGVAKARGFLTYARAAAADATRPWGTVEELHAGSTTDFDVDDLLDLLGKLAPRYQRNAAFVMHPTTQTYVRKLKSATTGAYYWQPSTLAGVPPTLLGLPCFVDVNMPTIAAGAGVVALADWKRFYAVVDVGSMMLLRDQVTSKGNTLFYGERRTGGAVVDSNAGKVLVLST